MKANIRVSVMFRSEISDPHGSAIQKSLQAAGFQGVTRVRSGKVITLELDVPDKKSVRPAVDTMCKQLLAHPVTEDYTYTIEFDDG